MGLRTALGLKKPLSLWASRPALDEFRRFCQALEGQDCVVFGSAPDPSFGEEGYRGEKIVCCNGSAATLDAEFGLRPDFTFLHSHVLARENEADQDVRDALAKVDSLGDVVLFHKPEFDYSEALLNGRAGRVHSFLWKNRYDLIHRLVDASPEYLRPSTGAMAASCALFAGARSVRLVGCSFVRKGHSYNTKNLYRNHVASDAALYAMLTLNGYRLSTPEPSVSMVLAEMLD